MTETTADDRPARPDSTVRTIWRAALRLLGDALALTLWIVFLTLTFLETGWPRWAFYGLLIAGVMVYVSITAPWARERSRLDSRTE